MVWLGLGHSDINPALKSTSIVITPGYRQLTAPPPSPPGVPVKPSLDTQNTTSPSPGLTGRGQQGYYPESLGPTKDAQVPHKHNKDPYHATIYKSNYMGVCLLRCFLATLCRHPSTLLVSQINPEHTGRVKEGMFLNIPALVGTQLSPHYELPCSLNRIMKAK